MNDKLLTELDSHPRYKFKRLFGDENFQDNLELVIGKRLYKLSDVNQNVVEGLLRVSGIGRKSIEELVYVLNKNGHNVQVPGGARKMTPALEIARRQQWIAGHRIRISRLNKRIIQIEKEIEDLSKLLSPSAP